MKLSGALSLVNNLTEKFVGPDTERAGISAFKANVGGKAGFQRTNRYQVFIDIPNSMRERLPKAFEQQRDIDLRCTEVNIPDKTINTKEYMAFGTPYKWGDQSEFDGLSATFLLSQDHRELAYFNMWMHMIHSHKAGRIGYYKDYIAPEFRVSPLTMDHESAYMYVFESAFPKSISVSAFTSSSENEVATVTVNFAFRRFLGNNQLVVNPLNPTPDIPEGVEQTGILGTIAKASKLFGAGADNFSKVKNLKDRLF